jgi:hypothetical protein
MVQVYGNNTIISLTPIHFPYTKASASVKYALSEASIAASNEHRNPLRKMGRAPVAKSAMFSLISPSLASIFVERRVVVSRWREGAAKEIFFWGQSVDVEACNLFHQCGTEICWRQPYTPHSCYICHWMSSKSFSIKISYIL